jgi:serpin B
MNLKYVVTGLSIAALISSCGTGPTGGSATTPLPQNAQVLQSSLARQAPTNVPAADLATLVAGNNQFAFDLYQHVAQPNANLFYSPYSISLALAMTWAGARSETETEMAQAMRYALTQEKLHPAFNLLDQTLASRGDATTDSVGFKLCIANAIWGQADYSFLSSYLDVLALNYGAGLRLLDFKADPEACRLTINGWVADNTQQRIQNILQPGIIDVTTKLVLANAIYFKAGWEHAFSAQATTDQPFRLLDGTTVTVPLMSQTDEFSYARVGDAQAVELPYSQGKLSMVVILPDSGKFSDVESALENGGLTAITDSLAGRRVAVSLPRFTYGSGGIGLKEVLGAMGMPVAFTDAADFSGIDGERNLKIGNVIHKAWVAVDEKGTEAAAATVVVMYPTCAPVGPAIDFRVDRPFVFVIRDIETKAVLFVGRIVNPLG